jgi:hypothetical protein
MPPESYGLILTRAFVCSDDRDFYTYCDQISKSFLNRFFVDTINHYLILIHRDLSTDVYVNEFPMQAKILAKRDVKAGEAIGYRDIADIAEIRFPGIDIKESDCIILCFKKGWKFGLFFDLNPADGKSTLDTKNLFHDLGGYYRYLSFQEVYLILKNEPLFEDMFADGWFPFIQLLGGDFEELAALYKHKQDLPDNIDKFLNKFNKERIELFVNRWWKNSLFKSKQGILEAGVQAYLLGKKAGYINCVKTLYSEIDGIVRISYRNEKGKDPSFAELVEYTKQRAEGKFGRRENLGFSDVFYRYLSEVFFKNFDLGTGRVDLSRHTVSHGVADQAQYTKNKALQAILILDQMYFYLT